MKNIFKVIRIFLSFVALMLSLVSYVPFASAGEHSPTDWRIKSLPEKPSLRSSAIVGGQIWVAGTSGKIFKSNNKGKSWLDISLTDGFEGDVRDIEVLDKKTAIAMTVGEGEQSRLYKTIDSGKHWKLMLKNKDQHGFFDSIDFWDRKNGLLLGDPVGGYYVVLKTTDGGKNWQRIAKKNLPTLNPKEAAFAASGNTLITANDNTAWITTGGFSASIYYSNDGGESWHRMSVPLYAKNQTSGGYGLATNSKGDVFVVGGDYKNRQGRYPNIAVFTKVKNKIKPSTIEKQHWRLINAGQRGLRTALTCQKNHCLASGKSSTDISLDNGFSWRLFSSEGFYTLASEGNLFVGAGHDGRLGIYELQ